MVMRSDLGIVILAAGLGKRMNSGQAKVLHTICGRPMIEYVVRTAAAIAGTNVVVVVGHQAEKVQHVVGGFAHQVKFALQKQQLGTGHAVICALPQLPETVEKVMILCGDVPLISTTTLESVISDHCAYTRDVTLLAVRVANPKGYGRIVLNSSGALMAIVEEADADEIQKNINIINSGIYVVERPFLASALPRLRSDNAQHEIYLTDIIGLGAREQKCMGAIISQDADEIIGVNSQNDLKIAEDLMKHKFREIT